MEAIIALFTASEHGPVPSKLNLHAGHFCLPPSKRNTAVTPTLIPSGSRAAHPQEQHHIIMWALLPTGGGMEAWCPGGR